MVLRALLALSAVHKRKVLDPANRVRDGLPPDSQEIFFLKQYNGALRAMQDVLQGKGQSPKSKLILSLIMCGIFTLLESLRGNFEAGKIHLASGSKLAKQLLRGPYQDGRDSKFIQFFARLEDQTQVYEQAKQSAKHIVTPLSITVQVSPGLRFVSLEEAGHHLDALIDLLAHSAEQARKIPPSSVGSRRLLGNEHAYLVAGCEAWNLAFEATFKEKLEGMSAEDISAWRALKERHATSKAAAEKFLAFHTKTDDTGSTTVHDGVYINLAEVLPRNTMLVAHGDVELQKQILFNGTKWHS